MIKLELTALLYSNKNLDLAYKINKYCYKMSINLVNCINFVELTIKTYQLKPQLLFCDLNTIDLNSSQLRILLDNALCKNTKLIFIGSENREKIFENLQFANADFVNTNNIEAYILNCLDILSFDAFDYNDQNERNIQLSSSIIKFLYSLGFSPKYTGFNYLKEIIYNIVNNGGVFSSLIGDQYPFIAVKFKTTCCNVERNIRNAIASAYKEYKSKWHEAFDECFCLQGDRKPTNREFICLCSDSILKSNILKRTAF